MRRSDRPIPFVVKKKSIISSESGSTKLVSLLAAPKPSIVWYAVAQSTLTTEGDEAVHAEAVNARATRKRRDVPVLESCPFTVIPRTLALTEFGATEIATAASW